MRKLKNKQYKSYDKLSRYGVFPYYYNDADKKYIYGTTSHLDKNNAFSLYEVRPGDTLDLISVICYNTPLDYWVIADFNNIKDPFKKLEPGTFLKIPVLSTIHFV